MRRDNKFTMPSCKVLRCTVLRQVLYITLIKKKLFLLKLTFFKNAEEKREGNRKPLLVIQKFERSGQDARSGPQKVLYHFVNVR